MQPTDPSKPLPLQPKIKLAIEEEYGYRLWVAYLTKEQYDDLITRWNTMRGLHSLVPVTLIIPQALPAHALEDINIHALREQGARRCHIHEHDDSYLEGSIYNIPAPEYHNYSPSLHSTSYFDVFWMCGHRYTQEELEFYIHQERMFLATFNSNTIPNTDTVEEYEDNDEDYV